MLTNVTWPEHRSYRSGSDWEPFQFYLDALIFSNSLDLLLGYFSSSAINILSLGFAKFISSGGTLRLIVNDILSEQDKAAILEGKSLTFKSPPIDFTDIRSLKNALDEYGRHFFECLSWLVANDRLQIKVIRPKNGKGISHYKSGVFSDGINKVGFKGSCNFTSYGLLENLEEIDSYLSWENGRSTMFLNSQSEYFLEIFEERADFVEYLPVSDVQVAIRSEFGGKEINELLIQESELLARKKAVATQKRTAKALNRAEERVEEYLSFPKFPYSSGPRPYQIEAYNNWVKNDYKGIFAMATGTGKTITSLNCLLQATIKNEDKVYNALILVPTITLVNQWAEEARSFNFQEIIKVSSREDWEGSLATTLSIARRLPTSFIVITTYASFVKDRFNKYVNRFPVNTILIADEAHNIGAPSVLDKVSRLHLGKRIGLSATPKRIYDIEGSIAMEAFFHDTEPYTYSFSMERAIEEGILCKYYYHPHIVSLTTDELAVYVEITKKLSRFFNKETRSFEPSDIVEKLLLKRKRIIHKAENKLIRTQQILRERFQDRGDLKYTFVYVPEGRATQDVDDEGENDDDVKIINQYTRAIGQIDDSIMVNQFVSGMSDRNEVLEQFKDGKIQVIASMKCLDEGVDIPRAEHAIFCSSTGNPRQFIQRRGRILRRHPKKDIAIIHDLVVIPDLTFSDPDSDTYKIERSLVEKELERVMYFASLAINPFETERVFSEVCEHYDLNIYTIHNKLKSQ